MAAIVIGTLAGVASLALIVVVVWRYHDNLRQRLNKRPLLSFGNFDNQSLSGVSVTSEQQLVRRDSAYGSDRSSLASVSKLASNDTGGVRELDSINLDDLSQSSTA